MVPAKLYEVFIKDSKTVSGFSRVKMVGTNLADVVNSYKDDEVLMIKFVETVNIS